MSGLFAIEPARWPDSKAIIDAVAKHGEIAIFQAQDKASGNWIRVHTLDYKGLMAWLPSAIDGYADHVICLIVQADPLKFVLLKWTPQGVQVAQAFQLDRDSISRLAINALSRAKKCHSAPTLARQAWKEASLELKERLTEEEFKRRIGGALKSFRADLNPRRPMFLEWWTEWRGPPDDQVETYIYELRKSMTVEEYRKFRESQK